MHAFVTGGSGFIGRALIRQLIKKEYSVTALVRSEPSAAVVLALGATPVFGDVTDLSSLEKAIPQVDVLFHLAAHYAVGGFSAEKEATARMTQVNLIGTHNVLTVAHARSIPKIVVTSSIAVFGDTQGLMVHEADLHLPRFANRDTFLTEYERTKWQLQYELIPAFITRGAPIVTVLPSVVYGLDGGGIVATLLQAVRKSFPLVVGSDTQITLAHVEDVASGHILAAEKGAVGESYILAGDEMTVGALVKLVSAIGGQTTPQLIDSETVRPIIDFARSSGVDAELFNLLGVSYLASAEKARRELGWHTRPLFEGLTELVHKTGAPTKKKTYLPISNSTLLTGVLLAILGWRWLRR